MQNLQELCGSKKDEYESSLLKGLSSKAVAANTDPDIAEEHRLFMNAQIIVPLKYFSIFFSSLEMSLINCKIHLELNWTKNSIMSSVAGATIFQITSTKLYVPIVTLATKESQKLIEQLQNGFKRSVYWNEYKTKIETDKKQIITTRKDFLF